MPTSKRIKNKLSIFHDKVHAQVDSVTPSNEINATCFLSNRSIYLAHNKDDKAAASAYPPPKYPILVGLISSARDKSGPSGMIIIKSSALTNWIKAASQTLLTSITAPLK
ncbi:hypothetical protein D3C85_1462140 [compost metagenome]